ncbi:hypothetical protein K490DRAFT_68103 [Saccharata proteae CBS 121410]|uniref:Uncharacterized protein n=1 Tax=Saccharata proteae CBS 121410 TaxID=1314787 RepID=A0A9P4HNP5_9PEZI|nr:hypothetical protein K490DRAFT_68103 [Saccharata proteae CBS 121410]
MFSLEVSRLECVRTPSSALPSHLQPQKLKFSDWRLDSLLQDLGFSGYEHVYPGITDLLADRTAAALLYHISNRLQGVPIDRQTTPRRINWPLWTETWWRPQCKWDGNTAAPSAAQTAILEMQVRRLQKDEAEGDAAGMAQNNPHAHVQANRHFEAPHGQPAPRPARAAPTSHDPLPARQEPRARRQRVPTPVTTPDRHRPIWPPHEPNASLMSTPSPQHTPAPNRNLRNGRAVPEAQRSPQRRPPGNLSTPPRSPAPTLAEELEIVAARLRRPVVEDAPEEFDDEDRRALAQLNDWESEQSAEVRAVVDEANELESRHGVDAKEPDDAEYNALLARLAEMRASRRASRRGSGLA